MSKKLNVLLAITDTLATNWRKGVEDFTQFFKSKGGDFKGVRKTYVAEPGTQDDPSKSQYTRIVTTVGEKYKWFEENQAAYIDALFAQEKTNSVGVAKAKLVVEGVEWGEFSSLELLRLKSLIENGELYNMYLHTPVRSDSEQWEKTDDPDYTSREVWEQPLQTGISKSIEKESIILVDPNIEKLKEGTSYTPQIGQKNKVIDLGRYTVQHFSGEISHRERADILRRKHLLALAVTEALKVANEAESVESGIKASRIFGYLHRGVNS